MGTKTFNNYESLLTFTRASKGHALRPVSYGSEEVTNGTFDSDLSGWNIVNDDASNTVTYDSGAVDFVGDGSVSLSMNQDNVFTVGVLYQLTIDVTVNAGNVGGIKIQYSGLDSSIGVVTESGSYTFNFVPNSTTLEIYRRTGGQATNVTIDNISVKEVTFDESDGTLTLFEHPDNIPRVEWDAQRNRLGLLVEEARTNLATYSEDLSQGSAVNSPTITTNIATAPNGIETVDGIQDTSGGNFKRVKLFSGAVSANSTYTGSLFVKKETVETNYGGVVLSFTAGTSNRTCYGIIDAVNGTISPATANNITATFTVTDVGDFWRFSITGTDTGSNTQLEFGVYGTLSVDGSTTGTGAGSVRRVWGAQLEAGSFPTSYIKTTGATATRSADVASIPVADFGYNQSAGTIFVEAQSTSGATNAMVVSLETDVNNRIEARYSSSLNTKTRCEVVSGGVAQARLEVTDSNEVRKISFAFTKDDFASSANGSTVVTDTAGTLPSATKMDIGEGTYLNSHLNGHIKSIKYYPRRLSNAQLVELTS